MLTETHEMERDEWDTLAAGEVRKLSILPPSTNFYSYANRSGLMIGVADFLDDLQGNRVLEYGLQAHYRKMIETTGSLIERLLRKSIHAVTALGFELKIVLFVVVCSLRQLWHAGSQLGLINGLARDRLSRAVVRSGLSSNGVEDA